MDNKEDMTNNDIYFMNIAIKEAQKAALKDEVPVGAVIVRDGKVIAKAGNSREKDKLPSSHAEFKAMMKAAKKLGGWRLVGCTLYVTLEPCAMCAGAIINSRLPRVVYGAYDKRFGALGSVYSLHEGKLNHIPEVKGGVLEDICARLLSEYFRQKRGK